MSPRRLDLPANADRLLVVLSDIEMGAGGPFDDFPHSGFLGELIASYNDPPYADIPIDLVLNGDTFDLLKTSYLDGYPRHISSDVALGKMTRISAAHPRFFEALRQLLRHRRAPRRVHYVVGNHDPEIQFPEVQQLLRDLCGDPGHVEFPGLRTRFGKVVIEHGSQFDRMFEIDPAAPFVTFKGTKVLNVSWAAAAALDTMVPMQPFFHFHDRLKPRGTLFQLMPELKELIVGSFWNYFRHDYWQGFLKAGDPIKKVSWRMVRELAGRVITGDPEINMNNELQRRIIERDDVLLYVVGHLHQPGCWSYGDRKVLQSGCFRNEYMLSNRGRTLRPVPKNYIEVFMRGDSPLSSQHVELPSPPAPQDYIPESIFDVLPRVRELLAEVRKHSAARRAHEDRELAE